MIISMMPRIILMALPSILSSRIIARVEKIMNAPTIGRSLFHVTNLRYFTITTVAEVNDNSPDRVTASPYEGIRKGSAVMMNMPNPNPIVLWTKLAPAANSIMYSMLSGMPLLWSQTTTSLKSDGLSCHVVRVLAGEENRNASDIILRIGEMS